MSPNLFGGGKDRWKIFWKKRKSGFGGSFLLIIAALVSRAVIGANNTGVLIVLAFLDVFIYILFTAYGVRAVSGGL